MLRRQEVLAVRAIEQEEVAVAVRLRQQLARLPVDDAVDEHRRLRGVPVVRVVRRHLVVPRQLAGVRIDARRSSTSRGCRRRGSCPASTGFGLPVPR